MAVCDICNQTTEYEKGYVLTTQEVATNPAYWEYAFRHQWSYVLDMNAMILPMLVQQQANQSSGWLLCESCGKLFSFDKNVARQNALNAVQNPERQYGTAPAGDVLIAATQAFNNLKR
jgi:hypothetical protein